MDDASRPGLAAPEVPTAGSPQTSAGLLPPPGFEDVEEGTHVIPGLEGEANVHNPVFAKLSHATLRWIE